MPGALFQTPAFYDSFGKTFVDSFVLWNGLTVFFFGISVMSFTVAVESPTIFKQKLCQVSLLNFLISLHATLYAFNACLTRLFKIFLKGSDQKLAISQNSFFMKTTFISPHRSAIGNLFRPLRVQPEAFIRALTTERTERKKCSTQLRTALCSPAAAIGLTAAQNMSGSNIRASV